MTLPTQHTRPEIEDSTPRWESVPDEMRSALATHDDVLRVAIETEGGWLSKHTGDGVCAAFESPGVTVLASRKSLGVAGEWAWPVPSLDVGPGSTAMALFVARARAGGAERRARRSDEPGQRDGRPDGDRARAELLFRGTPA